MLDSLKKVHKMQLLSEYFEKIRSGSKRVEMRLLDEKRRELKIGDIIEFCDRENPGRTQLCEITDLKVFDNFLSLAESYNPRDLGFSEALSPSDIANYMYGIYCECSVIRCSALAIEIKRFKSF